MIGIGAWTICRLLVAASQVFAAGGHVFHHAVETEGPAHAECGCLAWHAAADSCACEDHHADDSDTSHDCDECSVCAATEDAVAVSSHSVGAFQLALAAHLPTQDRPILDPTGVIYDRLVLLEPPGNLHAVTLPLLN